MTQQAQESPERQPEMIVPRGSVGLLLRSGRSAQMEAPRSFPEEVASCENDHEQALERFSDETTSRGDSCSSSFHLGPQPWQEAHDNGIWSDPGWRTLVPWQEEEWWDSQWGHEEEENAEARREDDQVEVHRLQPRPPSHPPPLKIEAKARPRPPSKSQPTPPSVPLPKAYPWRVLPDPTLPISVLHVITYGIRFHDVASNIDCDLAVDARCFRDPGAGALKAHDGHHPDIMTRMVRHERFPQWFRDLRCNMERIARSLRGGPLTVAIFCRSGRHRCVAGSLMLEHVAHKVGVPIDSIEHATLDPCSCPECTWHSRGAAARVQRVMSQALQIWETVD